MQKCISHKKDRRQVNLKIVNCGGAYRDCIKRHGDKT